MDLNIWTVFSGNYKSIQFVLIKSDVLHWMGYKKFFTYFFKCVKNFLIISVQTTNCFRVVLSHFSELFFVTVQSLPLSWKIVLHYQKIICTVNKTFSVLMLTMLLLVIEIRNCLIIFWIFFFNVTVMTDFWWETIRCLSRFCLGTIIFSFVYNDYL